MLSRFYSYVRDWAQVPTRIRNMEETVATAAEQIDALSTKVDGVTTVTADILSDFRAFRDAVQADREQLTEAGQAALDRANAKLDDATTRLGELDVEVGDADGSDNPPVEPTEPGTDTFR